jgi:hypothetical protein
MRREEARSAGPLDQRAMHRRPRSGPIAGSDRVVDALRLNGGTATLVALVDALKPALGRRESRAAIELARIGGHITLTEGDDEQLVARLVEAER